MRLSLQPKTSPKERTAAPGSSSVGAAALPERALRLAVVGIGPKGLYVLERLALELASGVLSRPVDCYLFEPHPYPGAGPVYDPRQPHYLRLNFANRFVDLWSRDRPAAMPRLTASPRLSLVEWLQCHRPSLAEAGAYAPRAVVGDYLHNGYQTVVSELRRYGRVRLLSDTVTSIVRCGQGWEVGTDNLRLEVDEVVLTTGHDSRGNPPTEPHRRLIPAVFPVTKYLSTERIPAGSEVAIRGFGLTALDAVLALFEGRGGRFRIDGDTASLGYEPGADEAAVAIPFSRSGRPMVPKPDPRRWSALPQLDGHWADGRARLRQRVAETGHLDVEILRRTLLETAFAAHGTAWAAHPARRADAGPNLDSLAVHLDFLWSHRHGRYAGESISSALSRSLEVAYGERAPDDAWALGAAWRGLYPTLVEVFAAGVGLAASGRQTFYRLAVEMERLAFGPPAENAARFLALVRSGRVDLSWVDNPSLDLAGPRPRLRRSAAAGAGEGQVRTVDVIVHAVLAPPGIAPHGSPLFDRLRRDGNLRLVPGTGGADIDGQGQAVDIDGRLSAGLAVLGRPTEGCVLGNDTLSRTLHPQIAAWAGGLTARHRQRQEMSP